MFNDPVEAEPWLRRVVGAGRVVLLARELGPAVPVSQDLRVCAQFFRPWSLHCRLKPVAGGMSIEAPLVQIVAGGHLAAVLDALRQTPVWLRRTLRWPHSALERLVSADVAAARAHLAKARSWTLSGMADWEAAGVYWATLCEDLPEARRCLEKAAAGHWMRFRNDQATLAWAWLRLCGDADCAHHRLYDDMDMGPTGGSSDILVWHTLIAHAEAWRALFGQTKWTACYLEYAQRCAGTCGSGGVFQVAMAWRALLPGEQKDADMAAYGMRQPKDDILPAAFYWGCLAGDPAQARACLWRKEWADYASPRFRLALAEGLVFFAAAGGEVTARRQAEALVQEVARDPDTDIQTQGEAAEWWSGMVGAGAEAMLEAAVAKADESCEWIILAEAWLRLAHLPADRRLAGACEALERAEALADNTMDFTFCADAWKYAAGDEVRAERCLVRGEDCADSAQELALLANRWIETLGRPDAARRLVLETAGSVLDKELD